jgi:HK97 family phage prohead protease
MKEDWFRHRASLMSEHQAPAYYDETGKPRYAIGDGPGSRPHAWWMFEAQEPRRLISGSCKPLTDRLWEGIPALYDFPEGREPEWESQLAYLERLNLLTDEERRHFAEQDEIEKAKVLKFKRKNRNGGREMRTLIVQPASRTAGRSSGAAFEYRAGPQLEIREGLGEPPKIKGYAAIFNVLSQPLPFRERILPGAFRNSLTNDVRALVGHVSSQIIGRKKNKTLELREDTKGLYVEIEPPNTTLGHDTVESIKRGDLDQMSFGFVTISDQWKNENTQIVRELIEVDLLEVSVVAFPAYTQTSVSVRSALTSPALQLIQELEKSCGPLRTEQPAIQQRNEPEGMEYSDRARDEVPPMELKEPGVVSIARDFRTRKQTITFANGKQEIRAVPTSVRTVPLSQPQQEKTPRERLLELEHRYGIKRVTQRQTPRERLELLERRYDLKPATQKKKQKSG